ncbi:MAG: energy transducer TonB [Aquabacterium sp.]
MSLYPSYQPDSRQNATGIAIVVALHIIVVYALVSGLARKVVDVVRAPIETKVIEEVKDTPPPPDVIPPPPVLDAPPPFIPPPEVTISAPPQAQPTIAVATPTPPQEAVKPTPPPVVAPPPPAQPAVVSLAVACPTRAVPKLTPRLEGIAGSVRARLTIKAGRVVSVDILSSTPKGVFDGVVRAAVLQYGCQATGDGATQVAEQSFEFKAE